MWGLVGKNLVKREWLLIGGVRMWGFEPFDDERAIKTKRAPAHVCTRTYLPQRRKINANATRKPPSIPSRFHYSWKQIEIFEKKKGEKKLVGPCSVVGSFQGSLVGVFWSG